MKFRRDLDECYNEYQQIYENLSKDKFEKKLTLTMKIKSNFQILQAMIIEFVPIKKKRSIALNYSSDSRDTGPTKFSFAFWNIIVVIIIFFLSTYVK